MDNKQNLIDAINSVRRVHKLWYVAKTPIAAISFDECIKLCEKALAFNCAVKLRMIENFFHYADHELNERFNSILSELERMVNCAKQNETGSKSRSCTLAGNPNADKRIVDR